MTEPSSSSSKQRHLAIVAGFGPVGRVVTERLLKAGLEVTIIELNPDTVTQQSTLGRRMVRGDASDPAVLREAGIEQADALIVTIPDEVAAVRCCGVGRELGPNLFIAVRTKHLSRGFAATQAGADHVVAEELVTAEAMQQAVMKHLRP